MEGPWDARWDHIFPPQNVECPPRARRFLCGFCVLYAVCGGFLLISGTEGRISSQGTLLSLRDSMDADYGVVTLIFLVGLCVVLTQAERLAGVRRLR